MSYHCLRHGFVRNINTPVKSYLVKDFIIADHVLAECEPRDPYDVSKWKQIPDLIILDDIRQFKSGLIGDDEMKERYNSFRDRYAKRRI